tara:strand:- start:66 stop:485 length:420 start_codon:yes stop_codon:yes gene_type:complete
MSNYLTTNPVFKLAKHDNDLASRYYFDEEKDLEQEIKDIDKIDIEFVENPFDKFGAKKNVYARYKSNVKQRIITIIREIELKNLEYTKNLVIILGKYRNIYTKIIIDEKNNKNRIDQFLLKQQNDETQSEAKQELIEIN